MAANKRRCVIISASPDKDEEYIKSCVRADDYIVCADGGADAIAGLEIAPDLIVGDFDSAVNIELFKDTEIVTLNVRKIDTDTMHCVDECLARGFTEFLFLGATGGRSDHALANLSILLYLSKKGAHGVISDRYNDIMLLSAGENMIHTKPGKTISVLPFGAPSAVLSYEGLSYPLDHGEVKVSYPYTISNEAVCENVSITLHRGCALVFIVKDGM